MIDERSEELATLHALGILPAAEAREFDAAMARDPELRSLVEELHNTAAALAHAAPPVEPDPAIERALLDQIRGERPAAAAVSSGRSWLAWAALAAICALVATFLGVDRSEMGKTIADLRGKEKEAAALALERVQLEREIAGLREMDRVSAQRIAQGESERATLRSELDRVTGERARLESELTAARAKDAFSSLAIRTLTAQLAETRQTLATVVWSQSEGRGVLAVEKLKPPGPAEDYQLWVIDGKAPAPVSAGLIRVDEKGAARYEFKAEAPVGSAEKFAISREKKGGAPSPKGPIVLISL